MSTMNEAIIESEQFASIVAGIDLDIIRSVAQVASNEIDDDGYSYTVLEPGDSTRYEIAIVSARGWGAPYRVASSFGPLYRWMGNSNTHPDYAKEHYVADHSVWTAVVIALFLNMVSEALAVES
jgi:hypothetical protein